MTPDDIAGTFKETRGVEIVDANGRPLNHIEENLQAQVSIDNAIELIEKYLDPQNGRRPPDGSPGSILLRAKLAGLKDLQDLYENEVDP
jgi:hypothetical protein